MEVGWILKTDISLMENKKIKNATPKEYNGIKFKSLTEVMVYKTLLQEGFEPFYEGTKYVIWKGPKPEIPFYKPNKNTKKLKLDTKKIIDITYTPDFVFIAPDNKTVIIFEVKGHENDTYPIKEKMFRGYLEKCLKELNQPSMFFKIGTKKQCLEAINIIKQTFNDKD